MNCWAETYCKAFNEERTNCHEYCFGYVQLENLYSVSNIPKRYQYYMPLSPDNDADFETFVQLADFMDDVKAKVKKGRGLFLYSEKKGNGKTSWACKIANEYIKKVALDNNLRCRVFYINVPDFIQLLKDNMSNPSEHMQAMIYNIRNADLVIWDDIGTETPTTWVRQTLYTYINHRYSNMLSQIFTSNIMPETLCDEQYMGERIVDRIAGCCDMHEFTGQSRRY